MNAKLLGRFCTDFLRCHTLHSTQVLAACQKVLSMALFLLRMDTFRFGVRARSALVNDASLDGDRESTSLTFSQFTATAGERNNTRNNDSAHTQPTARAAALLSTAHTGGRRWKVIPDAQSHAPKSKRLKAADRKADSWHLGVLNFVFFFFFLLFLLLMH